jgi:hypothetical protein
MKMKYQRKKIVMAEEAWRRETINQLMANQKRSMYVIRENDES